jgi:hypothetical protein
MRNEYNISVGGDHLQDQGIDERVTLKDDFKNVW